MINLITVVAAILIVFNFVCQRVLFSANSKGSGWSAMSNGGYQRPIMKVPGEFSWTVVQLIKWRDSVKDRRKAMAIQRVIDRKVMWAHEHHMKLSLYMYCVGCGYDLYGRKWGK